MAGPSSVAGPVAAASARPVAAASTGPEAWRHGFGPLVMTWPRTSECKQAYYGQEKVEALAAAKLRKSRSKEGSLSKGSSSPSARTEESYASKESSTSSVGPKSPAVKSSALSLASAVPDTAAKATAQSRPRTLQLADLLSEASPEVQAKSTVQAWQPQQETQLQQPVLDTEANFPRSQLIQVSTGACGNVPRKASQHSTHSGTPQLTPLTPTVHPGSPPPLQVSPQLSVAHPSTPQLSGAHPGTPQAGMPPPPGLEHLGLDHPQGLTPKNAPGRSPGIPPQSPLSLPLESHHQAPSLTSNESLQILAGVQAELRRRAESHPHFELMKRGAPPSPGESAQHSNGPDTCTDSPPGFKPEASYWNCMNRPGSSSTASTTATLHSDLDSQDGTPGRGSINSSLNYQNTQNPGGSFHTLWAGQDILGQSFHR